MRGSVAAWVAGLVLIAGGAWAAEDRVQHTGTFSSFAYHEESGDLLGVELRIVPIRSGYQGTFQMAQGGPEAMILVQPRFQGNEISFGFVSSGGTPGLFKGTVADDGVRGTLTFFPGGEPTPYTGFGDAHLFLKRTCGYWDCLRPEARTD